MLKDPLGLVQAVKAGLGSDDVSNAMIDLLKKSILARQDVAVSEGEKRMRALQEEYVRKLGDLTKDFADKNIKNAEDREKILAIEKENAGLIKLFSCRL